ncbi:MAG: anthranilate synthase component II [Acidimicrobiales bacterium]
MSAGPSIVVIDNYDSFVYNLVQYLGELGARVEVVRNDELTPSAVSSRRPDGVLLSPGPGHPRDAGHCVGIVRQCAQDARPLLGVCLGHQAIGEAFGARIERAPELVHGRATLVEHEDHGVLAGLGHPFAAGRYHSLVVGEEALPDSLEVTARSEGLIMGVALRGAPLEGVQFHPESVLSQGGHRLLANWLATCGFAEALERCEELDRRAETDRRALSVSA